MKLSVTLLGLYMAVAMAGSVLVSAQPCDPSNCGEGPVRAFFQYSNCSGDVTFAPMQETFNWGSCEVDNVVNGYLAVKNELGYVEMWVYNTPEVTCDPRTPGANYNYYFTRFGFCFPVFARDAAAAGEVNGRRRSGHPKREELDAYSASSYMLLFNAQSSYTSPQNFDNEELPAFEDAYASCSSPNDCTLANGQPSQSWTTSYNSDNCQGASSSAHNPKLMLNTCTNYNNFTYRFDGCIDESHSYYAYFTDSSCTIPSNGAGTRQSCQTSRYANNCTGEATFIPDFILPFPLPPIAPTGTASFLSTSLLLALVACLAALFSF